jgi:altronate hydrolase
MVVVAGRELRATSHVPAGHKIAVREIEAGASVVRYGCSIGKAITAIHTGEHVHSHNLAFEAINLDEALPGLEMAKTGPAKEVPTFLGYPRADGRAGTRNYIAVAAGQQLRGACGGTDRRKFSTR